jgi:hypothetical protein
MRLTSRPASKSETQSAQYLGRIVRKYGPVGEGEVRGYAQRMESDGHLPLAHGLRAVAREMRGDEVVAGRKPSRARRSGR